MPADILAVTGQVDEASRALAQAGQRTGLSPFPGIRVLVAGPADAGKTTLVRGILGEAASLLPGLLGSPLSTGAPVEITAGAAGSGTTVALDVDGDDGHPRSVSFSPASPAVFAGRRTRQVRARLDAPMLRDWHVQLIDTPASDRAGQDLGGGHHSALGIDVGALDGVLYVVPSRGVTERDLHVLESLWARPVLVLQNLRDAEIAASTTPFTPVPVERSACGYAIPVALARVGRPSRERELVQLAVELLYAEILASEFRLLGDKAPSTLGRLRADYRARLDAVLDACTTAVPEQPLPVLHAAAALLSLDCEGHVQVAAEKTLASLICALSNLPNADHYRSVLRARAQTAARDYDVEAAGGVRLTLRTATGADGAGDVAVGEHLGELRATLAGYIGKLQEDTELRLTEADKARLDAIMEQLAGDRLEVIFAGQFSAGKSTLINALLETDLLPARRRPTTATINQLSYADTTTHNVRWLGPDAFPLDLTLLEGTRSAVGARRLMEMDGMSGRYRVHGEEISALASWLGSGTVSPGSCSFTLEGGDGDGIRAFRDLVSDLRAATTIDRRLPDFIYSAYSTPRITGATFPIAATIEDFATPPAVPPPSSPDVGTFLDLIGGDPAIALRVDRVEIRYRHELLRHVTIVDTPGTDAPIPRHRVSTEHAIKEDRQRAVVYCFNGVKAAGTEDERNLGLLRSCQAGSSGGELSRFFFVITHRGLHTDHEARQIQDKVAAQLRRFGIAADQIYFTEVVSERNDDFRALGQALNEFGIRSKGPLLAGWLGEITRVVRDVGDRERVLIERLGQDGRKRQASLAALRKELDAVRSLGSQLGSNRDWGIEWARGRARPTGLSSTGVIDREIAALVTREQFTTLAGNIGQYLAAVNKEAHTRVKNAWETTESRTRFLLVSGAAGERDVMLPAVSIPGEVFPSAEVLGAVRSLQWRSFGQRVKGLFGGKGWSEDIASNRARIERAWRASAQKAAATVDAAIVSAGEGALADFRRIEAGISAQLTALSAPPSDATRRAAQASLARSAAWLQRLDALSRLIEEHARGSC